MIIVNLKGGLGNQMFQYACGRALALKNQDELKLDPYGLERANAVGDIYRPFSLQHFAIAAEVAAPKEITHVRGLIGKNSKLWHKVEQKLFRRFHTGYEPGILRKKGDVYLNGFFQSEKYFAEIANTIRKDLSLAAPLSGDAQAFAEQICADGMSVSLHVRRGDYVTHPEFGGIADKAYYARAIAKIKKNVLGTNFYVFSDDIDWCKQNLDIGDATFIPSDLPDYETLALMSMCRHHIIANSTFSWWGAWLDPRDDAIIIAPTRWKKGPGEENFRDIIPNTWIRV